MKNMAWLIHQRKGSTAATSLSNQGAWTEEQTKGEIQQLLEDNGS